MNKHINHFPCHICPFYADSFLGGFIVLIRLYFLCHSGPCFGSGQQLGVGWMVDKTGYDIKCGLINATGYTIIINGSSTTEPSFRLKPIPTKFKNILLNGIDRCFKIEIISERILGTLALGGVSKLTVTVRAGGRLPKSSKIVIPAEMSKIAQK